MGTNVKDVEPKRKMGPAKVQKEKSEHNVDFAKGGTTPMFGHGSKGPPELAAGEQKPGVTEHDNKGGAGDKFATGGSTKMFGFTGALPARDGITSAR